MMNSLGGEALDDVGIGCSKSFDGNGGSESQFCFGDELNVFRRFEFGCVTRVRIWDQSPIRSGPHLVLAIYGPGQRLKIAVLVIFFTFQNRSNRTEFIWVNRPRSRIFGARRRASRNGLILAQILHTDADGNSGPLSACNLNNCSKGAPASVTTCVPTTVGICEFPRDRTHAAGMAGHRLIVP